MSDLDQRIKAAFELHQMQGDIEDFASLHDFKAGYLAALPRWIPASEAEDMRTYLIDDDRTTAYLYSAYDDVFTGDNDEIPADQITWILDIGKLPQPPEREE